MGTHPIFESDFDCLTGMRSAIAFLSAIWAANEGELRLNANDGGNNRFRQARYGRLEVFHNGSWGTICDVGFDAMDANVACATLGFRSPGWYSNYHKISRGNLGNLNVEGGRKVHFSNLECNGDENDLMKCGYLAENIPCQCDHDPTGYGPHDVVLMCKGKCPINADTEMADCSLPDPVRKIKNQCDNIPEECKAEMRDGMSKCNSPCAAWINKCEQIPDLVPPEPETETPAPTEKATTTSTTWAPPMTTTTTASMTTASTSSPATAPFNGGPSECESSDDCPQGEFCSFTARQDSSSGNCDQCVNYEVRRDCSDLIVNERAQIECGNVCFANDKKMEETTHTVEEGASGIRDYGNTDDEDGDEQWTAVGTDPVGMTAGNAGENSHMKGPTDYTIDRDSYDDSQTEDNPIQVEFTEDEAEFEAELETAARNFSKSAISSAVEGTWAVTEADIADIVGNKHMRLDFNKGIKTDDGEVEEPYIMKNKTQGGGTRASTEAEQKTEQSADEEGSSLMVDTQDSMVVDLTDGKTVNKDPAPVAEPSEAPMSSIKSTTAAPHVATTEKPPRTRKPDKPLVPVETPEEKENEKKDDQAEGKPNAGGSVPKDNAGHGSSSNLPASTEKPRPSARPAIVHDIKGAGVAGNSGAMVGHDPEGSPEGEGEVSAEPTVKVHTVLLYSLSALY